MLSQEVGTTEAGCFKGFEGVEAHEAHAVVVGGVEDVLLNVLNTDEVQLGFQCLARRGHKARERQTRDRHTPISREIRLAGRQEVSTRTLDALKGVGIDSHWGGKQVGDLGNRLVNECGRLERKTQHQRQRGKHADIFIEVKGTQQGHITGEIRESRKGIDRRLAIEGRRHHAHVQEAEFHLAIGHPELEQHGVEPSTSVDVVAGIQIISGANEDQVVTDGAIDVVGVGGEEEGIHHLHLGTRLTQQGIASDGHNQIGGLLHHNAARRRQTRAGYSTDIEIQPRTSRQTVGSTDDDGNIRSGVGINESLIQRDGEGLGRVNTGIQINHIKASNATQVSDGGICGVDNLEDVTCNVWTRETIKLGDQTGIQLLIGNDQGLGITIRRSKIADTDEITLRRSVTGRDRSEINSDISKSFRSIHRETANSTGEIVGAVNQGIAQGNVIVGERSDNGFLKSELNIGMIGNCYRLFL